MSGSKENIPRGISNEVVIAMVPMSRVPSVHRSPKMSSKSNTRIKETRRSSAKSRHSSRSSNTSQQSSEGGTLQITTEFQDEEFAKNNLLRQIEILKGDLERRSSKSFSDGNDSFHRRNSVRRGSGSSIESGGSKGGSATSDDQQDKNAKENQNVRKGKVKQQRTESFWTKTTAFFANMDALASKGKVARHDICILFSLYLIPLLLVIFIWDLMAVLVFEIPHLSMIEHPGLMLLLHFICVPLSMYGYTMRVLMGLDKTVLSTIGLICVVFHPAFLVLRAFIEIHFEGFQSQQLFRYESY